jgi:hypothetical protein
MTPLECRTKTEPGPFHALFKDSNNNFVKKINLFPFNKYGTLLRIEIFA